ncbi:MAG: YeeE/YedE thiosulfate transporter family protein [Desulfosalsimonas sp.]
MSAQIWLGLISGIVFGFIIQRAGATNADKMARAHLMIEGDIPRFMLLAVLVSAVGLVGLQASGVGRLLIIPTSLVAIGIAGILFGIGWGLCGYCPGTTWAAAGEGRMDAIFALIGGLAGTAVFAQVHGILIPLLHAPTNMGQITLADWFGSSLAGAAVLVVVFAVCIWAIGRLWERG